MVGSWADTAGTLPLSSSSVRTALWHAPGMHVEECVFCRVVSGDVRSEQVYQDGHTIAIMDLRQPGWPQAVHILVMPREHVEVIDELTHEQATQLMTSVVRVSRALRRACQPKGVSVWQSNGEAAGQEVLHVHVHLLTRGSGDGLMRIYPSAPDTPSFEDMAPVAESVRVRIGDDR